MVELAISVILKLIMADGRRFLIDRVEIFKAISHPPLKLHILFYNNGLATCVWHNLPYIRILK